MPPKKQTYKYKVNESILYDCLDQYELTENEFYKLYSFFVTYSMCGTQSAKKRTFNDYGWSTSSVNGGPLYKALKSILKLRGNSNFVFTEEDDLGIQFLAKQLPDGRITNLDYERAVIGHTPEDNNYLKLFYRIRDGLSHGKFGLLYSPKHEKMVVIQDNDRFNVTARIVIKLSTLLDFVDVISAGEASTTPSILSIVS